MELVFAKENNLYVAEFEATGDFNIHVEGVSEGNIAAYQRTSAEGGFSLIRGSQVYPSYGKVYDVDFAGVVYPKTIKVTCTTEPTLGVVTFNA